MRTIRIAALVGALGTPAVLSGVAAGAGLGVAGWVAGLLVGWTATALMAVARLRSDRPEILPADWITLVRALLVAGVSGLVADSFGASVSADALVGLAAAALALDAVDGLVARRTGTATVLGGRFDGEVDAFLILALSVKVYLTYGNFAVWVLLIGAARYLLLIAGWLVRWLAAPLPPRYWRKVVAAAQGIALTVAISGVVNTFLGLILVAVALALLVESFGRDVVWLFRAGASPVTRRVAGIVTAVLSVAILWGALVVPDQLGLIRPAAFARIPLEGLVLVAVAMFLPSRARRVSAAVVGLLIGLLTIVKVFDIGFFVELDRAFDPIIDWSNLQPAIGVVRDSIGDTATDVFLVLIAVIAVLAVTLIIASAVRVTTVAARFRRGSAGAVGVLGTAWVVTAALALQVAPGDRFAADATAGVAVSQVRSAVAAIQDQHRFETAIHSADPEAQVPAADLLTGLRGKDVLLVFVESYGQVAVQGTSFSPGVDAVLRQGDATLAKAGFSSRSAWITSPTFGGISWLAHSTMQSGLWVDNQQRYNQLVASRRFTLSDAFEKAGWKTVSDIPSSGPWPQGFTFYHYNQELNGLNVGYKGPRFSYARIPDQYTYNKFSQLVLGPGHQPVFAEIDTVSSHVPWWPLPRMVPWNKLGNGTIYDPMVTGPKSATQTLVANAATTQRHYGQSVQYSMRALTSWIARIHDPRLVVIELGDHQPATVVSGNSPTHDVPVSIIAHDPSVFRQISSWKWQPGLRPSPSAPVEQMDAFRNQFLDAFNGTPTSAVRNSALTSPKH